jgi:hypothetical protein
MKKILIPIILLIAVAAGYLYYDWDAKTKRAASEPKKILFTWTDEKGVKHFSDKAPPEGAKNVEKTTGFKYVKPPLITTIKNGAANLYRRGKNFLYSLFKRKSKRDRK